MSKKIRLFIVASVVFVVVLMAFAGTALAAYDPINHASDHSMISDTTSTNRHNLAPTGADPCEYCHTPHGANGAFLWAQPLPQVIPPGGQQNQGVNVDTAAATSAPYGSDIKPLCYSCHDGSVILPGRSTPVTVGSSTVFSSTHFNHRTKAASSVNPTTGAKTGLGADCDRCHDPHDDSMGNYMRPEFKTRAYDQNGNVVKIDPAGPTVLIKGVASDAAYNATTAKTVSRWSPLIKGGDVCATCHEANLLSVTADTKRNAHPVYQPAGFLVYDSRTMGLANMDITGSGTTLAAVLKIKPSGATPLALQILSTTPVLATTPVPGKTPTASVWPKAGPYAPLATPTALYNGTRVFNQTTNAVVASSDGAAVVMCESCHAPHGANAGVATAATPTFHYLNTMAADALCANCH